MNRFFTFAFLLLTFTFALAHQPNLVESEGIIEIQDPEISRAFYSELKGKPAYYSINSPRPFKLYVGILVPAEKGIDQDYTVEVFHRDIRIIKLDGKGFKWMLYHEDFGGDDYYQGPDKTLEAAAGEYVIRVSSPDNQGKYVLAVGEKESFPPGEMLRTLILLPKLKSDFFGKSPLTAYFNLSGLFVLIVLVMLGVLLLILIRILRPR